MLVRINMKNIKILLLVILSIITYTELNAQHLIKSKKFKISFESNEKLKKYKTESKSVLGFDNDNIAVDIEIFPLNEESEKFISNLKYGATELALDLGLKNVIDGGNIPYIKNAYYIIAQSEEEENIQIPVFVLAIINSDRQIAYEATIYCYNFNKSEGERITKSFKLIE